jgi:hypothetical protein
MFIVRLARSIRSRATFAGGFLLIRTHSRFSHAKRLAIGSCPLRMST